MRPPAFASENRTHGAEKIGPSRYSGFFDKIGQQRPNEAIDFESALTSTPGITLHRTK